MSKPIKVKLKIKQITVSDDGVYAVTLDGRLFFCAVGLGGSLKRFKWSECNLPEVDLESIKPTIAHREPGTPLP